MDIKTLLAAYAKSKTQYGGTGLFLMVLLCLGQGATHSCGFAWDGTIYAVPVSMSGLIAAVAAALYGLVLWGRGTASGPLVDATTQRAARLAKLARQAKVYEAALAELADTVQAQPSLTTEKPEGATPCEPPSSAV